MGRPVNRPSKVTADAMYDTAKIRKYNKRRGIKSNIPVNKRNRKKKKRGRPIKVDKEEYKKKSIVERFFSWIESCKKVVPRYEIKEESYIGVVMAAAIIRLNELLGQAPLEQLDWRIRIEKNTKVQQKLYFIRFRYLGDSIEEATLRLGVTELIPKLKNCLFRSSF
ncbi:MAG: transposase [Desulfitobacteriaceae bacterium]|nr:transposase [Desulfitobacteriaceae bacterium]